MTLSLTQLLDIFRLKMGFEPLRCDGVVTRTDGIDLDELLTLHIRAWYADLLANAPLSHLELTDIASTATLLPQPDHSGLIILPESVVRVAEVKLGGWERPAVPMREDHPDYQRIAPMQLSPYTRGGCINPVALLEHRRLRLYTPPSAQAHPAVERLIVVMRPADPDSFTFTELALSTIPTELDL